MYVICKSKQQFHLNYYSNYSKKTDESSEEEETAQEKRLRMAKDYLSRLEEGMSKLLLSEKYD